MNEDQPQPARAKRRDKGFTLIELLIVIAILGILSVVVVLSVNGITNRGQTSSCSADQKTQEIAAESYRAQNGTYPATQAQLNTFLNGPSVLYTYAVRNTPTAGAGYSLTSIDTTKCPAANDYTSP
jgi:prepilin-type N-terminal cleavage/methylation domain-containing protein